MRLLHLVFWIDFLDDVTSTMLTRFNYLRFRISLWLGSSLCQFWSIANYKIIWAPVFNRLVCKKKKKKINNGKHVTEMLSPTRFHWNIHSKTRTHPKVKTHRKEKHNRTRKGKNKSIHGNNIKTSTTTRIPTRPVDNLCRLKTNIATVIASDVIIRITCT